MQIQKYKYTNTAYDKVPESPNMLYIFEKRSVQGSNMQIQKYKCTNAAYDKVPERPNMLYVYVVYF